MATTEHLAKALGGRQPPIPADLTLKKIKDQIPEHYFEQNHWKSGYYVLRDLAQSAVTAGAMAYVLLPAVESTTAEGTWARTLAVFAAWNVYAFVQGINWTGLWVLAHECGHRAFSPHRWVNDAVGMVLHSALLVPYHSWRISHGTHHKHTNHMTQDTVFVPPEKTVAAADKQAKESKDKLGALANPHTIQHALEESPIFSLVWIVIMLTIGWPGYLLWNAAGQRYNRRCNHFEPSSPIFRPFQRSDFLASDLGLAAMAVALGFACRSYGVANVALWYGAPYLWVNAWLVFITYLQHTDVRLPHYRADQWNFVNGALAAVDRDYGWYLNWALHHINDSHVMHHLFSTMPFYNAIEVTRKHNEKIFGKWWMRDNRSLAAMVWESWRACRYVCPEEGVTFFRTG